MGQHMIAVLMVMGLLFGALHWLRRRGIAGFPTRLRRVPRRLQLIEKLPLTAQHSLHVVRMDDRALLIAVSPSGCSLLESRPCD